MIIGEKEAFNGTVPIRTEEYEGYDPWHYTGLELGEDLDVEGLCTLKITNDNIEIIETFTLQDYESPDGYWEFEVGGLLISYAPKTPEWEAGLQLTLPQNYGEVNILLTTVG